MKFKLFSVIAAFLCLTQVSAGGFSYRVISNDAFSLSEEGGFCLVVADAAPGFSCCSQAHVEFQPYGNQIEIWSEAAIWSPLQEDDGCTWEYCAQFIDLTTGQTMTLPNGFFSVDPEHIYRFSLSAEMDVAHTEEYGNGGQVQVRFFITPEPSAVLLLGLGALSCRLKRRR